MSDWSRWKIFGAIVVGHLALVGLVFYISVAFAGGINTAGGMCPDGVQEGDEGGGWSSTSNWTRLPQSEGMVGEQVSLKWDRVEMTVYMCNDGTMMGRAHPRRGTKGR